MNSSLPQAHLEAEVTPVPGSAERVMSDADIVKATSKAYFHEILNYKPPEVDPEKKQQAEALALELEGLLNLGMRDGEQDPRSYQLLSAIYRLDKSKYLEMVVKMEAMEKKQQVEALTAEFEELLRSGLIVEEIDSRCAPILSAMSCLDQPLYLEMVEKMKALKG